MENAQQIARLMCNVTEQVLWPRYRTRVQAASPGARLVCRIGRGKATYHRFDPRERVHLITYGLQMIIAKQQPAGARGWLSTREILQRGYFGGEVTVLNLLAHTCNHEFAHLLQQNGGQRFHGSVHNHHFYRLLDNLNRTGEARSVRDYLHSQASQQNICLPDLPMPEAALQTQHNWQAGDLICFGQGSRYREGRIRRINRTTCTVDGTGPWQGTGYRVPFALLRPLSPG